MPETIFNLKKYLLGDLDARNNEKIELQILSNELLEDDLLIAENDLIEDFIEKNLTPEEEILFYENFLISSEREEKVKEIHLFKQYSKKYFNASAPAKDDWRSSKGFWGKISGFFIFNWRFAAPLAGALIIALSLGIIWKIFFDNPQVELTSIEKEFSVLNDRDLSDPANFSGLTNIGLVSGTFRSVDAAAKLKRETLSENVLFRLALPDEFADDGFLKTELLKDQKAVFTQPKIRVYDNPNGQEIKLILPKSILSPGRWEIRIENRKAVNNPVRYDFVVE